MKSNRVSKASPIVLRRYRDEDYPGVLSLWQEAGLPLLSAKGPSFSERGGYEAMKALLVEFRDEQAQIVRALEGLLSNGGSPKVKEFKAALKLVCAHRTPCVPRGGGVDD